MKNTFINIASLLFALVMFTSCSDKNESVITETGTLEALEITISSQVSGIVTGMYVTEGSVVNIGDRLASIDSTDLKLQYLQAEANLRAAEAQLRLAREGSRQEDVIQAETSFESARSDLKRMEELWEAKSISAKQLEDARTRYTLAEQMLQKVKSGLRKEEIDLALARRDQASAQVASLRKKLSDCAINSPVDGTVIKQFVEKGELVGPGMPIIQIADLQTMHLDVYVRETLLPRIQLGQSVEVKVDAFKDRSFSGEIIYISSKAEFTPRNIQTKEERTKLVFAVRIRAKNPDGSLKAGLPADATIHLSSETQ